MVDTWRDRMKQRRKERQLSQETLAERLGLSPATIGHWETGAREPETLGRFEELARALDMHPAELIYGVRYADQDLLQLLHRFRELPPDAQTAVRAIIEAFSPLKS